MVAEALLVKTKDNHVIVFNISYSNGAEKRRFQTLCERACQNKNYNELMSSGVNIPGADFDADNTEFLHDEISGYCHRRCPEEYRNDLSSANLPPCSANTLQFSNTISDDIIPEMIKNIGCKLEVKDYLYEVELDGDTYKVRDFNKRIATYYNAENRIEFVRNNFHFPAVAYSKLQAMIQQFQIAKAANPALDVYQYSDNNIHDRTDRSLFNIYAAEYAKLEHREDTVIHELKHIKNRVFSDGMGLKRDAKRMSVEDCYRINVEDERSAYLSQLINSMNKYLKGGNFNDYTMFDPECDTFANNLKLKSSDAERLAYATNLPLLVREMFEQFNNDHRSNYDASQFPQNTEARVKSLPLTAPLDTDRSYYEKVRSLFYNFEVYNPATGRMESKNLSQYITPNMEVEITDEINQSIINPQKTALQSRLDAVAAKIANREINPDLVEPARALMRDSLNQTTFINQVDNFRVTTLYDDEPNQPSQSPDEIPSDRAFWSDNLKNYWKDVDGYQEIAKNNIEYKFKIKEATVCYTSENKVEVSDNADYDLYMKLLAEPTNKDKPVEFLDTLSHEQALTLYVACINSGRKPVGAVPKDLSEVNNLQGIPSAEMQKYRQNVGQSAGNSQIGVNRAIAQMRQYCGR